MACCLNQSMFNDPYGITRSQCVTSFASEELLHFKFIYTGKDLAWPSSWRFGAHNIIKSEESLLLHFLKINSNNLYHLNVDEWCRIPASMYVHFFLKQTKQGKSEGFDSCDRPSNLKLDSNRQFFCPCDREIWWMTLQNNRAPLLCYFKLCASFCTHWWIQT